MLPPGYVRGATRPIPSPTYPYQPCGTGIPGEQPPIHVVYMAALGTVLPSSQRFCIGEAPAAQWSFDGIEVPWILPESYRNPKGAAPDFPGNDNQTEGDNDKGSGTAPDGVPAEDEDDEDGDDDEGFETVKDKEEDTDSKAVTKTPPKDPVKLEGSGTTGADLLFDSDDEEVDAGLKEQIETAYQMADTIEELKLSEKSSSSSSSENSDSEDDDADPDETGVLPQPKETEEVTEEVEETGSGPAGTGNPAPEDSGTLGGSGPEVVPEKNPLEPAGTKGKGLISKESGKAPAAKPKLSTSAQGVRERAQTMLFQGAALAQALGSEEDVTRRLENYTGLLDGLQKLVGVMASGYEDTTEDIRSLVASTLDAATKLDRAFVAGASQALTEWTTTYQEAMSQGETGSIPEQLARWGRVREAGIALSRTVTSLTSDHKEGSAPGEIFQRLLPDCFQWVRVRTEATFSELHASLPTLLCRFVAPDQAGQIFSSIFTCMCNYNTEICGMAMAQTVVPVYTIPNTYRVQQSLWESLCQTIPSIAQNSLGQPRPAQQSSNPPVGAVSLGAGGSRDPGATVTREDNQSASASQTTRRRSSSREKEHGGVPVGIPPAGFVMVARSEFQKNLPVISLTGDDNPSMTRPQETGTPLKATPVTGRRVSGGKINVSKVDAQHLLWKMEDRQEMARKRAEARVSNRSSSRGQISGSGLPYGLPATLPGVAVEGSLTKTLDPPPAAPKERKKRSHADDNEIMEIPVEDEPVEPPKKKKDKGRSKEEVPDPVIPDDRVRLGTSSAKPVEAVNPKPATGPSGDSDEEAEQPKKKKKKKQKKHREDPDLERFREQDRKARAKEMARTLHRKLQRQLDFRSVRNYRKTIPEKLLDTINGADHSKFLEDKLGKEGNYMSKKNDHRRNLMTVEKLLSRIAKFAKNPEQRLKEAQSFIKSTFPTVHGMATTEQSSPRFVVRVLMDCFDEQIDCNHEKYGKEQNMGLHDVISPAATARLTVKEMYDVDGFPTKVKVDVAFCPFCKYVASHHRTLNNHVRMHLRAILVCGWPGCYYVHMQAVYMIEHSAEVHGMARAKPARDRGGD